jgi:hypothetical protein
MIDATCAGERRWNKEIKHKPYSFLISECPQVLPVKADSTETKLTDLGVQMAKKKKRKSIEWFGFDGNIYLDPFGKKVAVVEIGEYKIVKVEGTPVGQHQIWKGQEYCGEFTAEELKAFFQKEYNISKPEALKVDSYLKSLM